MSIIKYEIIKGVAPFTVKLLNSTIPDNIHTIIGIYEFDNVDDGTYTLKITDSNGCEFDESIVVDSVNLRQPTQNIKNKFIIGNTDNQEFIFNETQTNRSSHYDVNNLYLWVKTDDNEPIKEERTISYKINILSGGTSTFQLKLLSDKNDVIINQISGGTSIIIEGTITFKIGFIEAFINYDYNIDNNVPDYEILLNSNSGYFNDNLQLIDNTKIYGVNFNNKNIILMNF